jgi:hypothetical protein
MKGALKLEPHRAVGAVLPAGVMKAARDDGAAGLKLAPPAAAGRRAAGDSAEGLPRRLRPEAAAGLKLAPAPAAHAAPRRRGPCAARAAAAAPPAADDAAAAGRARDAARAARWDRATAALVAASTLPFLLLFLPQAARNARTLAAGNAAALAAVSWVSYATGLGGNALLLAHFAARREANAALVQAVGVAGALTVLAQLAAAGHAPAGALAGAAALAAASATMAALKLSGRLDAGRGGRAAWAAWERALALAGLALVPTALAAALGAASPLPGAAAAGAGLLLLAAEAFGVAPPAARGLWDALGAWAATALFALQPLPQLAANLARPDALAALAPATVALAAAGNALMVPRALRTRDAAWLAGSLWGCGVYGWAQLLSLWLGRAPAAAGGGRFLPTPLFAAATVVLAVWLAGAFLLDARAARAAARAAAA